MGKILRAHGRLHLWWPLPVMRKCPNPVHHEDDIALTVKWDFAL